MKEPLNIPKIKKYIKETHSQFMKNFGLQIEKVTADHQLQSSLVLARLLPIINCLKEAGVVDDFTIDEEGFNKKIKLVKKGHDSYVFVMTNGLDILIYGCVSGSFLSTSDFITEKKLFSKVQSDKFDWIEFNKILLDYIHCSIYERKKATEIKLGGILDDNE